MLGSIGFFEVVLAITITLFSFFRHLPWYKFYLTKVDFETTQVKIEFYEYDDLHTYTIPIDQIKVTKDKAFGIGSSIKLNFFQNGGLLFYQYQVIGWRDREKILSIYSQFKELGSFDRQGNEKGQIAVPVRERKYLFNEKELNDDIFGMAPASIEGLIVSVQAQGTGTYDNTGRRTDNNEEKSTEEDCCPGLGIGGAQARSQNAQAIAETTGESYESSYLELSESESRAGLEGAKEGILFIFGEWALVKVGTWAVSWVRVSRA